MLSLINLCITNNLSWDIKQKTFHKTKINNHQLFTETLADNKSIQAEGGGGDYRDSFLANIPLASA